MTNATDWRANRATQLEELADRARSLLLDRSVVGVQAVPHMDDCDSPNVLRLTLDDGSTVDIEGTYGGFSGRSHDEYVELLDIRQVPA